MGETMHVSPLDMVLALIIVASAIRVAVKGFAEEFSSMAAFILGFLASVLLIKQGSLLVNSWGIQGVPAAILAFVGIFVVVFVVVKLVVGLLGTVLESLHLGSLNHGLGLILGLAEGCLLACIVLIVLEIQPFVDVTKLLDSSVIARFALPLIDLSALKKIKVPEKK
jgi:membrane protein required for colicin V production